MMIECEGVFSQAIIGGKENVFKKKNPFFRIG